MLDLSRREAYHHLSRLQACAANTVKISTKGLEWIAWFLVTHFLESKKIYSCLDHAPPSRFRPSRFAVYQDNPARPGPTALEVSLSLTSRPPGSPSRRAFCEVLRPPSRSLLPAPRVRRHD
jgi:hypothetical protein